MAQRTLLIADTDKFQRQLIDMLLAVDHYRLVSFETGREALAYLRGNTPDLAILSTELKDISGVDLCGKMKGITRLRHVPVILTTSALKHESARAMAKAVRADLVLNKPLGDKHLRERVQELLENARPIDLKQPLAAEPALDDPKPDLAEAEQVWLETENHEAFPFSIKRKPGFRVFDANSGSASEGIEEDLLLAEIDQATPLAIESFNTLDKLSPKAEEAAHKLAQAEAEGVDLKLDPVELFKHRPVQTSEAVSSLLAADASAAGQGEALTYQEKLIPEVSGLPELELLKTQLEDFLEENEQLKELLRELKDGKAIITTETYLDAVEELEALRRLTEHQNKEISRLRDENQALNEKIMVLKKADKRTVWERLKL